MIAGQVSVSLWYDESRVTIIQDCWHDIHRTYFPTEVEAG
jgi:hypothetical protein